MIPLISRATAAELIRVIAYPKFRLTPIEQEALLADCLPWCETVCIPDPPPVTPVCRDAYDAPFLELALTGQADALVSGDDDLLTLAKDLACPIVDAEAFLRGLDANMPPTERDIADAATRSLPVIPDG